MHGPMEVILFLVSVTSLVLAIRASRAVKELEAKAQNLRNEIERLHKRLTEVRAETRRAEPPAEARPAAVSVDIPVPPAPAPAQQPVTASPFLSGPPPIPAEAMSVPPPPPPPRSSIPVVD